MEKQIDWEERRFWAASLILASMHANSGTYDISYRAEDAVKSADTLIKILKEDSKVSE